jgi:hypothetical protein
MAQIQILQLLPVYFSALNTWSILGCPLASALPSWHAAGSALCLRGCAIILPLRLTDGLLVSSLPSLTKQTNPLISADGCPSLHGCSSSLLFSGLLIPILLCCFESFPLLSSPLLSFSSFP